MLLGLRTLISIEPDLDVCGECSKARGAVDLVSKHSPDVILVDINLPDGSGLSLIREIRAVNTAVPILVVSMHPEEGFAERSLDAGANGYLNKHSATEEVVGAIRHVLRGEVYASPEFTRRILNRLSSCAKKVDPVENLTRREFEVLEMISSGEPSRRIASRLSISPKTVETHRANIRSKLGLRDGGELARFAIRWAESETPN